MRTIYIGKKLEELARRQPDKIALYFKDEKITYRRFYQNVQTYKHALQTRKNKTTPQKVALLIGNEPAFLEMYFAIISLGWVVIPFDPKWSEREAIRIIDSADPDIFVSSKKFEKRATYSYPVSLYIEHIKASVTENQTVEFPVDAPFYLGFTSGSTGHPKGFIRNHQSWLTSFQAGENAFGYGTEDVFMAPGPLCHSLSLFGATHALHIGASFYVTTTFSAQETFQFIQAKLVTVVYAVPTMLSGLARQKEIAQTDVIFLSSGAKLLPVVKRNLKKVFPNSNVYEYYGASELSFVTFVTEEIAEKYPHSVGKPFPGVTISIRDEQGAPLPTGEIGHIYIHSLFLFSGYVNNQAATAQVLTEHGATIGDLGSVNEEGVLSIIGRQNNMIISGAQNIYPEEIEKVIHDLSFVKEAIIIGVDDAHWGQIGVAFIQWNENNLDHLPELKAHCRKNLAIYKRPRKYYVVDHFPYTPTGKIDRKEITENLSRWMT